MAPGLKVRIRKMACHNGRLFGHDRVAEKERAREEKAKAKAKAKPGFVPPGTAAAERKRPAGGRGPNSPPIGRKKHRTGPAPGGG